MPHGAGHEIGWEYLLRCGYGCGYSLGMTNTQTAAPWETFITAEMESAAQRQALKLVASGHTIDAAAAEAAAWVAVKAKHAMIIANLPKRVSKRAR